ncbi:hypothetical protein [Jannaschia formosa]|uniref:hypothetical protein n=1 Tax=Jannaschia formosa TaxID=2259592 RepID=UPI001074B306|nr:hypothetical protein [Jannaschia formosa]TFL17112.1 hypothetical protein DR046_16365 [Jannaschia formosa]
MKTLNLHVGHGKTGSSYIQSVLALSQDVLARNGISYPDLLESFTAARQGRITSGNVNVDHGSLVEHVTEAAPLMDGADTLLLSNEGMFRYFRKREGLADLAALRKQGFEVRILCFIRDPLDHVVSVYQQKIKRSGYTGDLKDYLPKYSSPTSVMRLIKICDRLDLQLTLSNYSRHREQLLPIFEAWLGLPTGTLETAPYSVVNRSMTTGEMILQRAFNKHLGKRSAALISNPLCNQLPEIQSENPAIRRAELDPFLDRMRKIVSPVNKRLDAGEAYEIPELDEAIARFRDPDDPSLVSFSEEQIEILARKLSRAIDGKTP